MKKHIPALTLAGIVACLAALLVFTPTDAQQVLPNQQRTVAQIEPPGAPLTTQTAFCQTSTGAAQANTITVAALAGKTIYVTGFEITGNGATANANVAVTLAFGGTTVANYSYITGTIATPAQNSMYVEYTHPIVGPTVGTNCVLTVGSFGSGNTAASVTLHGYYE